MDSRITRAAIDFLDGSLPGATTIVVGGSTSTGRRTATSDVDLLVFAAAESFENGGSRAWIAREQGERFEIFAYTPEAFRDWCERDFRSLRPVLPYLLVEGILLREGPEATELRDWAALRLEQGPRLPEHELDVRRYLVTGLVDDLSDATDDFTASVVRGDLVRELAQFLLLARNRWLGSGKWLVRRLRASDATDADRLAELAGEPDARRVAVLAAELLAPHGGLFRENLVR